MIEASLQPALKPVREAFGHKLHWFTPGQKKLLSKLSLHLGIGTATFATMRPFGFFFGHSLCNCEARTAKVAVRFSRLVRPAWAEWAWNAIEVESLDGQPQARIVAGCFDHSPLMFPGGRRYGIVPSSRWFFARRTGLACCQSVSPLFWLLGSPFTRRNCLVDDKGRLLFRTHLSHMPSVVMEEAALNSADLDVLLLVAGYFAWQSYQRPFAVDVAPSCSSEE